MSKFNVLLIRVETILDYHIKILKTTLSYQQLADSLGHAPRSRYIATCLGKLLDEDAKAGQPLRSASVIHTNEDKQGKKMPGEGFFTQARLSGLSFQDNELFWKGEIQKLGIQVK